MIDNSCPDKDLLVTYLYGEGEPPERERFEAHLEGCTACRDELAALERVRVDLGWWEAPEPVGHVRIVPPQMRAPGPWAWVRNPAFGLAAAALLVLAVATAIANVEIRYDIDGVSMRAGWGGDPGAGPAPEVQVVPMSSGLSGTPWRDEIETLARQLRGEMEQQRPASFQAAQTGPAVALTPELRRQIQQIVEDSEQRQRQDLALRLAELSRDVEIQRRSDLVRIQQVFGRLEGRTEAEAARQREMMNYFVRVSQQAPQR
jgi:hypothetical protein